MSDEKIDKIMTTVEKILHVVEGHTRRFGILQRDVRELKDGRHLDALQDEIYELQERCDKFDTKFEELNRP